MNINIKIMNLFKIKIIIILLLFTNKSYANIRELPFISIMASHSLNKAIVEISKEYSKINNITFLIAFYNNYEMFKELKSGYNVTIMIFDNKEYLEEIEKLQIMDDADPVIVAKNKLVLVAKKNHEIKYNKNKSTKQHLNYLYQSNKYKLLTTDFGIFQGVYTMRNIATLGHWRKLRNSIDTFDNSINIIDNLENNLGIIYNSDYVANKNQLKIISKFKRSNIEYWATAIQDKNTSLGVNFLNFLSSDIAKNIFKKNGFEINN